jgi:hypothetical protein
MLKNATAITEALEKESKANSKALQAALEKQIVALLQTYLLTQNPLIK